MSHRSLNPKPYCCLLFCCCCSAGFCCCSAMVLLLFCCGSAAVLLRPFSLQLSLLPGRALVSPTIPSPWQGPFLSNYPFSLAGPFSLQLSLLLGRQQYRIGLPGSVASIKQTADRDTGSSIADIARPPKKQPTSVGLINTFH